MLHAITCGGLYSLFSAAVFSAVVLTADKTPRDGALPIIENLGGAAMRGFVFDLDNTLFDRYGTIRTLMLNESERIIPYINVSYDIERAIEHVIHTEPLYILGGWEGVYELFCREHFLRLKILRNTKRLLILYVNALKNMPCRFRLLSVCLKICGRRDISWEL